MDAVEGNNFKSSDRIIVQTAPVNRKAIGMRSGTIKRMDAANPTKHMLGNPRIKDVSLKGGAFQLGAALLGRRAKECIIHLPSPALLDSS